MRSFSTLARSVERVIDHPAFIPACLGFGTLLRLLWILSFNATQTTDFEWYRKLGVSIAEGAGYYVNGRPFAYWPVGYPAFLGSLFYIFGQSALVGKLANIVLSVATIFLTYFIGKRLIGSERAARIAAFILAFSPNQIAFTDILSTETYFAFLILAATAAYVYGRRRLLVLILSGILFGLAVLTKTQGIFVPVFLLPVFFANWRVLFKEGAIIVLMIAVITGPWIARNYSAFGLATLDLHGGIALFIGNNPYADGHGTWDNRAASMLGDLAADEYALVDGREVERDERAKTVAVDYILSHPTRTLLLMPKKLFYLWASDVDGVYYSVGTMLNENSGTPMRALYRGLRVGGEIYYVIVVLLFIASVPLLVRRRSMVMMFGLILIAYFTVVYLLFFGVARYHFSLMPWVAIYAGLGGERLLCAAGLARADVATIPSAAS